MCSTFDACNAEGLLRLARLVPLEDLTSVFGALKGEREAVAPVVDPEAWDELDLDDEGA